MCYHYRFFLLFSLFLNMVDKILIKSLHGLRIYIERGSIGIYLSLGTINPCDFIRYRLIYGRCLSSASEIEHRL